MKPQRVYENGYRGTEEFPEYIEHYLYFSLRKAADLAAEQLVRRGWTTRVLPAAVGDDWLVLATQPATGEEEMDEIYNSLAQFAESFNGTYDGWERPADFEDENVN
jgi:hypothetical protein